MSSIRLTAGYPSGEEGDVGSNPIWITKIIKNMDILYIVGNFSKCDDWEFKFSLRSIDKYGKNIGRVFVCGYCPDWLSDNIIKIPYESKPSSTNGEKNRNIYDAIIYAVENSDVGINDNGDFLLSMDDHYILNNVDFGYDYPHYIKDYCKRRCRFKLPLVFEGGKPSPDYQKLLCSTARYLCNKGLSHLNFTLHRNIRVNRGVIEVLQNNGVNNDIFKNKRDIEPSCLIVNYEYSKKNINSNYHFPIEIVKDFKTNNIEKLLNYIENGGTFYSTSDFFVNDDLFNTLYSLFPEKSKYESYINENIVSEKQDVIEQGSSEESDYVSDSSM